MEDKLNKLLNSFDDEIEKKCFDLQQKRKERFMGWLFIIGCAFFVIVPVLLAISGVSFTSLLIPLLIFIAISTFAFSILLFNKNPGGNNETV